MAIIKINTKTTVSNIYIQKNNLKIAFKLASKKRIILITDTNLFRLYKNLFENKEVIVIEAGEKSKNIETIINIYNEFQKREVTRDTFVLGVGGGVVTDITGFVASTWHRGLEFGFIATSLLAQVDASIGGKNGINLNNIKNCIGTIKQPKFIVCNIKMLSTLPDKEFINGIAECVKSALIGNKKLFKFLENNYLGILNRNIETLIYCITETTKIKAKYIEKDEFEKNKRRELNFGHSFGHIIEVEESIPHGFAVSAGMCISAKLSEEKGLINKNELMRIQNLLKNLGLPTQTKIDKKILLEKLKTDKKQKKDFFNFVFLEKIGKAKVEMIKNKEIRDLMK